MTRQAVEEIIREVLEKHPVSQNVETVLRVVVPSLVDAYDAGYRDGKAAAHE